jgi:hypothetical protein
VFAVLTQPIRMRSAITSGCIMPKNTPLLPDRELVLSATNDSQRFSHAGHFLSDLWPRFNEVLAELQSVAGEEAACVQRSEQILGSPSKIETGVRQSIPDKQMETSVPDFYRKYLTDSTMSEIFRIKDVPILKQNAKRDYFDFMALADHMGYELVAQALKLFNIPIISKAIKIAITAIANSACQCYSL